MQRRNTIIELMRAAGEVSDADASLAKAYPLQLANRTESGETAPYYIEWVRQQLESKFGQQLYRDGLKVYTTLDLDMQSAAERALERQLRSIEEGRYGKYDHESYEEYVAKGQEDPELRAAANSPYLQGAFVALDPRTGAVRALVGGRDFDDSKFNRAVQAQRQPGSTFKPIVYAAAVQNGRSPSHIVDDSPIAIENMGGETWSPENYDRKFLGPMPMRRGLYTSRNIVAIKTGMELGPSAVIDEARRFGITTPIPPYPSIFLGSADVYPIEMIAAYSVFATLGTRAAPYAILRVENQRGDVLWEPEPVRVQVLSPEEAYLMVSMMRDVNMRGTAAGAVAGAGFDVPSGGKTGTTNDGTNVWYVGYTLGPRRRRLGRARSAAEDQEQRAGGRARGTGVDGVHEGGLSKEADAARLAAARRHRLAPGHRRHEHPVRPDGVPRSARHHRPVHRRHRAGRDVRDDAVRRARRFAGRRARLGPRPAAGLAVPAVPAGDRQWDAFAAADGAAAGQPDRHRLDHPSASAPVGAHARPADPPRASAMSEPATAEPSASARWRPRDCHAHSTFSDGALDPADVVARARSAACGRASPTICRATCRWPCRPSSTCASTSTRSRRCERRTRPTSRSAASSAGTTRSGAMLPTDLWTRFTHTIGSLHAVWLPDGSRLHAFQRRWPDALDADAYMDAHVENLERFAREMPVDVLAHPTLLPLALRTRPLDELWTEAREERAVAALGRAGIAFEVSNRYRPHERFVRRAVAAGVRLALGSDGHSEAQIADVAWPLAVARALGVPDEALYDPAVHGRREPGHGDRGSGGSRNRSPVSDPRPPAGRRCRPTSPAGSSRSPRPPSSTAPSPSTTRSHHLRRPRRRRAAGRLRRSR